MRYYLELNLAIRTSKSLVVYVLLSVGLNQGINLIHVVENAFLWDTHMDKKVGSCMIWKNIKFL